MAFGAVVQFKTGTAATASVTPTLDLPTTAGNLLLLTIAADDYNSAPPAFWTEPTGGRQHTFHGGYLWYRRCIGADTIAAYTIGSASRSAWTLVEYEGPFDASPYDISAGQNTTASSQTYSTPNLTPTSGDRLLVAGLQWQNGTTDLIALAGFTNSFTQAAAVLFNGANPRLSIAQTRLLVTANGSTAYSTGATSTPQNFNSASGIIAAFKKGAAAGGVTGTLNVTLGGATLAGAAKALVKGTLSTTLGNATLAATGTVANQVFRGTLTATLADATLSATGKAIVKGTLNATLAPATLAAVGTVGDQPKIIGTLNVALADATLAATGKTPAKGTLTATLGDATLSATGKAAVRGTLGVTLGDATLTAFGTVANQVSSGALNIMLADATLSAIGTVAVRGSLDVTLADATLFAKGKTRFSVNPPSCVSLDGLWPGTRVLFDGLDASHLPLVGLYEPRVVLPWQPISRCSPAIRKSLKSLSRQQVVSPSISPASISAGSFRGRRTIALR